MAGGSKILYRHSYLVGAVLGLVGCVDNQEFPRASVRGTVQLDGRPLPEGSIRFVPLEETPGQKLAVAIEDGHFKVKSNYGPAVGRHRIEIESTDTGGLEMDDEDAIDRLRSERKTRVDVVKVPAWYNRGSGLTEWVEDGENEFVFELSSKRRR
ncbi:MAG: hypothetical protein KDB22_23070 [Planctomycetales bacterium]|nr:hypothetical protein [Planctomycetales bacterium]